MKLRLAWCAIRHGNPGLTGVSCYTPIVILTLEFYHDISRETIFEVFCHFYGDDIGLLYFEDNMFESQPGIVLTPDGGNLVIHGVGGEFCTLFVLVLAVWYPTAGDLLCIVGHGDALFVTGFAY